MIAARVAVWHIPICSFVSPPYRFALLASCHHYLIAARIHFVFFQRSWRRTTDILSAQIVLAVVTGTPNLFGVVTVLDDAFKVRADGREGFEFSTRGMHQDARLVAKLENFSGVRRHPRQLVPD